MTGDRMGTMVYFKLFTDNWPAFEPLSLEDRGRLISALFAFQRDGTAPKPEELGDARFVWGILQAQLLRDQVEYSRRCEDNRRNGQKGGRPRKANGFVEIHTVPARTELTQDKDIDEEKEYNEVKEDVSTIKSRRASQRRFTPPTLDDVVAYCKNRNSPIDPKRFWEYYTAGKWRDGTGKPVKCWKQKILSWERDELGGKNGHDTTSGKTETSRTWGEVI